MTLHYIFYGAPEFWQTVKIIRPENPYGVPSKEWLRNALDYIRENPMAWISA